MAGKKSTKAVVAQRVHEVLALRIEGAELPAILAYVEAEEWGVSEATVLYYIAKSDAILGCRLEKDRERLLQRQVDYRRLLLSKALAKHDLFVALQVLKDEAKLAGLYPDPKAPPVLAAPIQVNLNLTDEQRDAAILNLLARVGQGHLRPSGNGQPHPARLSLGGAGGDHEAGGDGAGPLAGDGPPLFGE